MPLDDSRDFKSSLRSVFFLVFFGLCVFLSIGCQETQYSGLERDQSPDHVHAGFPEDDLELAFLEDFNSDLNHEFKQLGCRRASDSETIPINDGNKKLNQFMSQCLSETGSSSWCQQLTRPNPRSRDTFECTYGSNQPHQLIHPDEETWQYAIGAVKLIDELARLGIKTCEIYNWWRPEPYNRNVGGAKTRHPFGTSVDVRFCSKADQEKAFKALCHLRKDGWVRAIGYYSSSALHLGVGDSIANTWGKDCP